MKRILKNTLIAFLVLSAHGLSAQLVFDFTSSTNLSRHAGFPWGNTTVLNGDLGCFISGTTYGAYYDAIKDGLGTNTSSDYYAIFWTPEVNVQGSYTVSVEYTATGSFDIWSTIYNTSNGATGTANVTPLGASATKSVATIYVNGATNGNFRQYINVRGAGGSGVIIHSVTLTNSTYTPPTNGCSVTTGSSCPDVDSDGVCDNLDDFPNDPNKAFISTNPWMNWMYEDLFPAYGDFDFNDMVVSAEREVITDADNDVRFVKVKAVVKAAGAGMAQGWALELTGITPGDVVGVNGSNVAGNVMTLGGNGTENGQTNAVIPVFDNFNNIINRAGGAFFNTIAGSPTGTCDTVTVMIELKKSSAVQIGDLNYNFFSFRSGDRSHEIHEMGDMPTDLANMTLFGTKMDASDLNNGESYVSVDGLPWAISSSGNAYPTEKTDMVEAFLKLAVWAQSGGSLFLDWHTTATEGVFRNSTKIY